MAPKAAKRSSSAPASPKKKTRVDPMFAGIITTLHSADDLSEQCREMLIAMVGPCLSTPKADRHNLQSIGATLIEETLQNHLKALVEEVEAAQTTLTGLEESKAPLLQNLEVAKTVLAEKEATLESSTAAHEQALSLVHAATVTQKESIEAQKQGDAKFEELVKEKAALTATQQDQFKTPMDAGEALDYTILRPFVATLGLEDSLASALPSCCGKVKDQRGGFDNLVLVQLGEAMESKISQLAKLIADEEAAVSKRKAAVAAAEAELESKSAAEKAASTSLQEAKDAQKEAEAAMQKASSEWNAFEPQVKEATENLNLNNTKRLVFEQGTLKDFFNLRDKVVEVQKPVEEEAANAGA